MITALVASLGMLGIQAQEPKTIDLDRFIYPMAPTRARVPVVVDTTDAPETAAWAQAAKKLAYEWYPTLCSLLATEDYKSPAEIKLVFKKTLNVPAYASGSTITINGKWVTDHPDDLGMVIHELTHVIQSYPGYREKPGWLVEGIADYIRWWRYEPEAPRHRMNMATAKYTDSYRTTAWWLGWVANKYDQRLVPALDRAMRNRQDPMPIFQRMTGKTAEELWKEFADSRR